MGAVLAHISLREPTHRCGPPVGGGDLAVEAQGLRLLDECDVTPRIGAELARVVVAVAGPLEPVLRDEVPLLAGDLARLAADADRRGGEEPDPRLCFVGVGGPAHGFVAFVSSGSTWG